LNKREIKKVKKRCYTRVPLSSGLSFAEKMEKLAIEKIAK